MISVVHYVQKLLFDHEFVVIPNFGGFISRSKHAYFDNSAATYLPMTKQLAFNESLKLDDGLLTQYLALNEQISTEEAQLRIKTFVESIRKGLLVGSYHLESIGCFSLNCDQKLVFEPSAVGNFWKESYGFSPLSATQSENTIVQGLVIVDSNRLPIRVSKINPKRFVFGILSSCLVATCLIGSYLYSPSERNAFLSSLNPFSTIRSVKDTFTKNQNSDKFFVATTELPKTEAPLPIKPEAKISQIGVAEPVAVEVKSKLLAKVSVISSPKSTETKSKTSYISDSEGKYHVIVGAYAMPDNATKCLKIMQNLGFNDSQILSSSVDGDLVKVSVMSCNDQSRAFRSAKQISSVVKTSAWVFSY